VNKVVIILFLIFGIVFLLVNRFPYQKENKYVRITDTLIVIDSIQVPPIIKYIKVFAKSDTIIKRKVDSLITLQKDSLAKLLNFVLTPFDTTFNLQPSGLLRVEYDPLNRDLNLDLILPKQIIKTITIKDSVTVTVIDWQTTGIISGLTLLIGLLIGIAGS
jgi:hypothetical protein